MTVDLLDHIPELLSIFFPGFVYMYCRYWLKSKNVSDHATLIFLWSILVGVLISSFWSIVRIIFLPTWNCPEPLKIIVYVITAGCVSYIIYIIGQSKIFQEILHKTTHQTSNDVIWDDIIDYDKNQMMIIYLNSGIYYIGKFSMLSTDNQWITLIFASTYDTKTHEEKYTNSHNEKCVAIPLKNVDRIELMYEKDSMVWKRLWPHDI